MKIYALAIVAYNGSTISLRANSTQQARNDEEAIGIGIVRAKQLFPEAAGWSNHSCAVCVVCELDSVGQPIVDAVETVDAGDLSEKRPGVFTEVVNIDRGNTNVMCIEIPKSITDHSDKCRITLELLMPAIKPCPICGQDISCKQYSLPQNDKRAQWLFTHSDYDEEESCEFAQTTFNGDSEADAIKIWNWIVSNPKPNTLADWFFGT